METIQIAADAVTATAPVAEAVVEGTSSVFATAMDFVSDNAKGIAVGAAAVAVVYGGVKYATPAVRKFFAKKNETKKTPAAAATPEVVVDASVDGVQVTATAA